jgi:hypothetical protein
MSWISEVLVAGDPKWYGNGLRFATRDEAEKYVRDLEGRWTSVRRTRVAESDAPATHRWSGGHAVQLEKA